MKIKITKSSDWEYEKLKKAKKESKMDEEIKEEDYPPTRIGRMKSIKIESVLTKEQLRILDEWVKANNLDPKTIEILWEYKYGLQIWAKSKDNQEGWSIDFVDKKGE